MRSLDPDWPGNWKDEEDPKTEPIPDSMGERELLKPIKSDREKEIYRQYPFSSHLSLLASSVNVTVVSPTFAIMFCIPEKPLKTLPRVMKVNRISIMLTRWLLWKKKNYSWAGKHRLL